jgi:hypothetical protein
VRILEEESGVCLLAVGIEPFCGIGKTSSAEGEWKTESEMREKGEFIDRPHYLELQGSTLCNAKRSCDNCARGFLDIKTRGSNKGEVQNHCQALLDIAPSAIDTSRPVRDGGELRRGVDAKSAEHSYRYCRSRSAVRYVEYERSMD